MKKYKQMPKGLIIVILLAVLLVGIVVSMMLGRYPISPKEFLTIVFSKIFPIEKTWTTAQETAIFNIRLPRVFLACLVGGSLSVAGASYQGVFQNPMASPDILGASNGAAFGAALGILLGFSKRMIMGTAFLAGILTITVVFLISRKAKGKKVVTLILVGIMVSSLLSAGTSFIKLVADPLNQLPAITYWLMGSLSGTRKEDVLFALIPMAIGIIPLLLVRWRLNILTLGDDEARALGVNVNLLRYVTIACATLITAASVAVSGMIGWVGLVIPHLARRMVGNDYKYLLPASLVGGAVFLLIVDNVSRTLLAVEIPIGILTAVIGAPFFIWLIMRREVN